MTDHGDPPGPDDGPQSTGGSGGAGGQSREAAWDDVAARLSNLGKQVRSRFDQPRQPGSQERSAAGGDSVRRLLDTLDATFTKLGDTVRDPQFRKEAGSSVSRLGEALGVTLRDLGEQLQHKFGGRQDASHVGVGDPMPDVPPPPSPGTSVPADAPPQPAPGEPAGSPPPPARPPGSPPAPGGPTGGPPPTSDPAGSPPPTTGPAGGPPATPGSERPAGDPPADDERPPAL